MIPPIFQTVSASAAVKVLIGTNPVRFWSFDRAPEPSAPFYGVPYCTWQLITGSPENRLCDAPDTDSYTTQVDCWATTASSARSVAASVRDAIEPVAHITRWGGESEDAETGLYRISFDVDWITPRP